MDLHVLCVGHDLICTRHTTISSSSFSALNTTVGVSRGSSPGGGGWQDKKQSISVLIGALAEHIKKLVKIEAKLKE